MKKSIILAAVIIGFVGIALIVMISKDSKPSTFDILNNNLAIGGSFKTSVPLDQITNVNLTEEPPQIATKTNGSGIGTVYKGEFLLQGNKPARLYIDASKPPFVVFSCNDVVFYINLETPDKTNTLYENIVKAMKK